MTPAPLPRLTSTCAGQLLLRAGDVETNPGPPKTITRPLQRPSPTKRAPRKKKSPGKSVRCDYCENPFNCTQLEVALSCLHKGCKRRSHKQQKCSQISKYDPSPQWKCKIHNPTKPPEFTRPAYKKADGAPCAKCGIAIRSNWTPITCKGCKKPFHKTCSGVVGREVRDQYANNPESWTCKKCSAKPANETPGPTHPGISESNCSSTTKESLKIMQWNADRLPNKTVELADRLHENDIDVCLIQETKLLSHEEEPRISDYVSFRSDRGGGSLGGGLYFYIKETLTQEKLGRTNNNGTETASIRIKIRKNVWATLTNVYCPPSSSERTTSFDATNIPIHTNSIICGDFNGHDELWDEHASPDKRGEEIEEWATTNGLTVINDGTPTRWDRHSKKMSTPDVTFCGSDFAGKADWSVGEPIDKSDHLPITTTIHLKVRHQNVLGTSARWRSKDVDWSNFQQLTEEKFSKLKPMKNIKDRVERFVNILTETAKKAVGRTKPGKRTRPWLTPLVKSKIKIRNRLRRTIEKNRTEYREAAREVRDSIKVAKEESWAELLSDAITDADPEKFYRICKSLNGTPTSNCPNEVMIHNGKTITSNRTKANIFVKHYANVSKLTFTKADRAVNRSLKKLLRTPTTQDLQNTNCRDFSMSELERAISSIKKKGAAGPDDIPPTFLKSLGYRGKQELLNIINQSFRTSVCPQMWRLAIIVPLLKAGKSAKQLASFRPISLTSCVVKVFERMIGDRIRHIAESNNWLHPSQAGFRKGLSCEDQITRVIQKINDGLNKSPPENSVLVLLDFSKAYDTVWRQRLLLTLAEKGLPITYVKWLRSFLDNRQARVRFNNSVSPNKTFHQGLPQGSVLAPLLFICYINTLAELLPEKNLNCLFADDVAAVATCRDKIQATRDAQEAVDVVSSWSKAMKLSLNATKSEVSFFSNNTHDDEAKWKPTILIDKKPIEFQPTPRLLGVVLDRQMTFSTHTTNVTTSAAAACRMLNALSHSEWGWRKEHLRSVYDTFIKSKMDYSGPAWQPNLAATHIHKLERTQNKALRLITGQFADSPLVAVRLEAGVVSYETQMKQNILRSREKALRLPDSHPRRRAYDESVPQRLKRHSWRSLGDQLAREYQIDDESPRKPLKYHQFAPWENASLENIFPHVPGLSGKSDTDDRKLQLSYDRIRAIEADYIIYTDGSASGGVKDGGAAAVITTGSPEAPTPILTLMKRGSSLTCSYAEEYAAMHLAVDWIESSCSLDERVLVVTDSQSLCESLQGYGEDIADLKTRLLACPIDLTIQWVPGHSNIVGNDLADAAAKSATSLDEPPSEIAYSSICSFIKSVVRDNPNSHPRSAAVYANISRKKEREIKSRPDQVLLGRIRTGHHWFFQSYHNFIDSGHDTACGECGADLHDLEHWLCDCPANSHLRQRVFGDTATELGTLTASPTLAIAFARVAMQVNTRDAPQ